MRPYNDARLLTPRKEEEIAPYRPAWRSIGFEYALLAILTVGFFVIGSILGVQFPERFHMPINLGIALLPAGLWLGFSLIPESRVPEPRRRLLAVFVITSLTANAIGLPLIDTVIQPGKWLSLGSTVDRIIGYALTVGIIQELLKYLVIRYVVWPDHYRVRTDSIAYAAASATGYAMVINLQYVLTTSSSPDIVMGRVFSTAVVHLISSIVVAYGLSETLFSNTFPILMPFMIIFSAFLTGIAITLRAGLINASLTVEGSATRPYLSLGFTIGFLVLALLIMVFLFNTVERRDREAVIDE